VRWDLLYENTLAVNPIERSWCFSWHANHDSCPWFWNENVV